MKKKIILITNIFPYSPGEEFLETEIKFWAKQDNVEFIIMPKRKTNNLRVLPKNISIDYTLINAHIEKINQKKMGLKILSSNTFYKEIYSNKIINPKMLKHTLIACRDYLHYKDILQSYLRENKNNQLLFYSYWHTEVCYALQNLKLDFSNIKVISRIHGFDLYKERRVYNYMPLKKQFLNIDKLYTISDKGKEYITQVYNCKAQIVDVARLGVEDKQIITCPTKKNTLHILSCSSVNKIKRIDKIIEALKMIALSHKDINYLWTHIGDGALYDKMKSFAKNEFSHLSNIKFVFIGYLKNDDVYKFYRNTQIDVFLNVSESEGVPVSIMEALSCHIPVIAPDIGGISEMLINRWNGNLLSNQCSISEIADSLSDIDLFKLKSTRNNAYNMFLKKYNAKINYTSFTKELIDEFRK